MQADWEARQASKALQQAAAGPPTGPPAAVPAHAPTFKLTGYRAACTPSSDAAWEAGQVARLRSPLGKLEQLERYLHMFTTQVKRSKRERLAALAAAHPRLLQDMLQGLPDSMPELDTLSAVTALLNRAPATPQQDAQQDAQPAAQQDAQRAAQLPAQPAAQQDAQHAAQQPAQPASPPASPLASARHTGVAVEGSPRTPQQPIASDGLAPATAGGDSTPLLARRARSGRSRRRLARAS